MTAFEFYSWQTRGGADAVSRLVTVLEQTDVPWCVIGGIAVNHWAQEPMATRDVDLVIAAPALEEALAALGKAGFRVERHEWSVNLQAEGVVSIQISTESFYHDFTSRAVPAEIHGINMRVASLEDTLAGKVKAWREPSRRRSKRLKDLTDIARLLDAHPGLQIPEDVRTAIAD